MRRDEDARDSPLARGPGRSRPPDGVSCGARPRARRLLHRLRRAERDVGLVGLALVAALLVATGAAARTALDGVGADADVTVERGPFLDDQLGGAEVAFVAGAVL